MANGKSLNRVIQSATYWGQIDANPTVALQNLPTVNVLSSGKISLPSGTAAINIIRSFDVIISAASLVNNQTLLIVMTGGGPGATISLDNGGQIVGIPIYGLQPGDFLTVSFDGTNLNLIGHAGYQT